MKEKKRYGFKKELRTTLNRWQLYVMLIPAVIYTVVFCYKPMYGILIAFKNFSVRKGIMGSAWIGFDNFERLFNSYWFPITLKNTLTLSLLGLVIGFPLPIILALLLNELKSERFRKTIQTISYAPHFISTVVMCGMVTMFLSPTNGIINKVITALGYEAVYFMQEPTWFKWIYEISGDWQGIGWGSIIYFAALASVDKALLDAADVDGASRLQRIRYVNLPTIMPTVVVMFILRCGQILSIGYEKVYLLQNDLNVVGSEVISTYVYKVGLEQADFSFSTAAGLFNSVVNCVLLLSVNRLSKRVTDSGLF